MNKISFFALTVSFFLVFSSLARGASSGFGAANTPGNGFSSDDVCGYVMGTASIYNNGTTDFDSVSVSDADQGCVDKNGYFYSSDSRESYATYSVSGPVAGTSTTLTMDFAWSTDSAKNVLVDQTTGLWSGSAKFMGSSLTGSDKWVWFNWKCQSGSSCAGQEAGKYVRTDLDTGEITGYAWNDKYGFISFNNLTQELPPLTIVTFVDILASDTELGPDDVDSATAPLADGGDYWRIRVQFQDSRTGEFLTNDDILTLTITEKATQDSNVFLNQVEDSGDAILVSYQNEAVSCPSETEFCVQPESDGESFNTFVYSGAPTSNILGLNEDTDAAIEYYSDRDGCRWIYDDQWREVDGGSQEFLCPQLDGTTYDKADVFNDRQDSRNKYEIDSITIAVEFTGGRELEMYTWGNASNNGSANGSAFTASLTEGEWDYYPAVGSAELSFRPRFQINKFATYYDGAEHQEISEDTSKTMSLKTEAAVSDTSSAYQAIGGQARPGFTVNYQLDATSTSVAGAQPSSADNYLLIDTDKPPSSPTSGDVEETHREDSIVAGYSSATYSKDYAIGYGQKDSVVGGCSASPGGCPSAGTNTLSDPTAEQWVCDQATEKQFNGESCYYTEYLPHVDRHAPAESMLVLGAINSLIDESQFLSEDYVSILGTAETVSLRNKMYALVARYTLGQNAGAGTLDSSMKPSRQIVELMNRRLLYAEGNVAIQGSEVFSNKTLVVVGGDVFIDGNITGGKLGIIVFKSGGKGGNVWVRYDVTDIYTNLFLDGSLFSYSGVLPTESYPTWLSDEDRLDYLKNQLYLKGSLVSRNTVNGATDETAGTWDRGDGTTASSYGEAREYDLNLLRQYRWCYVLDADGNLTTETEACNEGEILSAYGTTNSVTNSFILEYDPADELPIFMAQSGLFK